MKSTTSLIFVLYFLIVIISLLQLRDSSGSSSSTGIAYAQIPLNELNSAIFIIQAFGSTVPQNETGICSTVSPVQFVCSVPNGGERHIEQINLVVNALNSNLQSPDFNTVLDFPELTELKLDIPSADAGSPDINILNYTKNLPKLVRLEVVNSINLRKIPPEFPLGLPSLTTFNIFNGNNIKEIPSNFFNGSNLETISIKGANIALMQLDPELYQLYLPKLKSIDFDITTQYDQTWTFDANAFPSLTSVAFQSMTTIYNETIHVTFNNGIKTVSLACEKGQIIPFFKYPANLQTLKLHGPYNYFYNPPNDGSNYPNLNSLTVQFSGLSEFPFQTVPQSINNLVLQVNSITGTIPTNFISPSSYGLALNLFTNNGISGTLSQTYCYLRELHISNTNITSIPNCWWCYSPSSSIFSTQLTDPGGDVCYKLFSKQGAYFIDGENIGWGDINQGLQQVIPNKRLSSVFDPEVDGLVVYKTFTFASTTKTFQINERAFKTFVISVVNQNAYSANISVTFSYIYSDFMPTVSFGGVSCLFSNYNSTFKTAYYILTELPVVQASKELLLVSPYFSYSTNFAFFRKTSIQTVSLDPPVYPPTHLILNGYFADSSAQVWVGNTTMTTCTVDTSVSNATYIKCAFTVVPQPGTTNIQIDTFFGTSILSVPYPLPTQDNCMTRTNNCNGHGTCVDGICKCDDGWYDDCKLQSNPDPNIIFTPNQTDPTPTFSYNDYVFSFSMIAIQEIDIDDTIIDSIETVNWNVTNQSTNDLSSMVYQLTTHQINSTLSPIYSNLNVTSTVEFSNQSRSIEFGGTLIQLAGGSIKIGVNVTNWPFQTLTSTLRIIFATKTNNDQLVTDCDGNVNTIESFQNFANADSIQYLRVTKGSVQFFGRFLDYAVSDGRKTYSKTELLNLTKIDDQESLATIAIGMPQCQTCLLDPDFSALLIRSNTFGNCQDDSTSRSNWKIIVGVVVGVVGAICISIVLISIIKKNRFYFILKGQRPGGGTNGGGSSSKGGSSRSVRLNSMRD
ncbi:hypothetical protein DFA_00246 [Cavenderia fasciculata]|uniref:EGF-like domain-containing protein n=1 Tax=Cavenderia fasciculata TaxID=261658 RepID=F4PY08_CACFS|nr:uncharacterized protein DFA_00246 [Cavenderia fasciculata]EGG19668.1 hypothetical protein DFA_00246 [Cavenderia fasciculata]|eukprot:XP_004357962.1 hypothetical protein DFA_00246 [Cavenderia fasciculata]